MDVRPLSLSPLATQAARAYVAAVMSFLARGVVGLSRTDPRVREELSGLPDGFTFEMKVLPSGPSFQVRKDAARLHLDRRGEGRPSLSIQFKHLRHAVRVLGFVEGTPLALASERMVVDGDVAAAMRVQRILERLQAILLPRLLAARLLKRAPRLSLGERARATAQICAAMAAEALPGGLR